MKYLAIDIGEVLCHCHEHKFLEALSDEANIPLSEANRFFKRFWEAHDLGHTTIEDELKDKLHIKSEIIIKRLNKIWLETFEPNLIVMKFFNRLVEVGDLQVAFLSNIGKEHAGILEKQFGDFWGYNLYANAIKHLSFEVGARKPTLLYYQSFLIMHPEFKGCLYIDDKEDNLRGGEKMGFKTHLFNLKSYMKPGTHYMDHNAERKLEEDLKIIEKLI